MDFLIKRSDVRSRLAQRRRAKVNCVLKFCSDYSTPGFCCFFGRKGNLQCYGDAEFCLLKCSKLVSNRRQIIHSHLEVYLALQAAQTQR